LIPKALSLALKSAVVLFPLIAGASLTILGGARLYEANAVKVDKWASPYGLLVFSSKELEQINIKLRPDLRTSDALQGKAYCTIWVDVTMPSEDPKTYFEEDIYIGIQIKEFQMDFAGETTELSPKAINLSYVEKDTINSVFYVQFVRQAFGKHHIHFALFFDWEYVIHREDFSTYSLTFPVAEGLSQEFANPYLQNPNAHYAYYADSLRASLEVFYPYDFEIKNSFPQMDIMRADVGQDARSIYLDIDTSKQEGNPKATQLISIVFEVKSRSEARSQLMFDSGLYMGLGVSLVFTGIHEAVRVLAGLHSRDDPPNP
jgi:hypothetical protein